MKKHEFIQKVKEEFQNKLDLKRFKISLIKCKNEKEVQLAKLFLELKIKDIYSNTNLQTKENATNYLKDNLKLFLLGQNGVNVEVKQTISLEPKEQIITIQDILNNAIKERKVLYPKKQSILKKQGVNIETKKDTTTNTYNQILKHVTKHFGSNFDIKNLNLQNVQDYANTFSNDTYITHLKAIFKRANKANPSIENWFVKLETSIYKKYANLSKQIKIFTFDEIQTILENLKTEEQQLFFQMLLYSGMRYDEAISLKKSNIKNDAFYFKDSKKYFDKVVPIHKDILDKILDKINTLDNDDYLFFNKPKRNIESIRQTFRNKLIALDIKKTLHNTRSTFITFNDFFKNNAFESDVKSLTHKVKGMDQEKYNKTKNIDRLKAIIDNIDLEKLKIIEQQL
ncbi:tyrosine-type recombinase/integrase [Aliarcobacter cryaerophilus]|uniref:tyrosine-type recombinase/integrase n=1 Tax=Aliarcobacter cryaerophilus TaxID=28198 RepID=UPI0021B45CAB|nr:tyrosine-type recombinase/integrase [Aliarcobacter cryaerophilus]MCT7484820.1 tyrosine-type recombinase/integrase [Aliarcobacter cryaerophilus]